jgi:hypothetical protein
MSEMPPEPTALMEELSKEFDAATLERHKVGQDKYGPLSFLGKDMFEEAIFELLDCANYMRYQYIKLRMIQIALSQDPRLKEYADRNDDITIGIGSFKGAQT